MQYRKLFLVLGSALAAITVACGGDKEAKPITTPPAVETPTAEYRHNPILNALIKSSLTYESILGDLPPKDDPNYSLRVSVDSPGPVYNNREEFLRYSKSRLPHAIVFSDENSSMRFQLARSQSHFPTVIRGSFVLIYLSGREGDYVCAPPYGEKTALWEELANNFEAGKPVDKSLVTKIMDELTDCF